VDSYIRIVWSETIPAQTYHIVANLDGTQETIGKFSVPVGGYKGRIFVQVSAQGPFIVAGNRSAMHTLGTIGLFTQNNPTGEFDYDPITAIILGDSDYVLTCFKQPHNIGA